MNTKNIEKEVYKGCYIWIEFQLKFIYERWECFLCGFICEILKILKIVIKILKYSGWKLNENINILAIVHWVLELFIYFFHCWGFIDVLHYVLCIVIYSSVIIVRNLLRVHGETLWEKGVEVFVDVQRSES